MDAAFPRLEIRVFPALKLLLRLGAATALGAGLAFLATLALPSRYGYHGLLEIPTHRRQTLMRPSAVKNFLQFAMESRLPAETSLRSIHFESDANPLVAITTYGPSLDEAKAVLDSCLGALSTNFAGPLEQHRAATLSTLESLSKSREEIRAELEAMASRSERAPEMAQWVRQDRELRLRGELRTLDVTENQIRTDAPDEGARFRFVEMRALSALPVSPNRTKWTAFGAFVGLFLGLFAWVLGNNVRWRWR